MKNKVAFCLSCGFRFVRASRFHYHFGGEWIGEYRCNKCKVSMMMKLMSLADRGALQCPWCGPGSAGALHIVDEGNRDKPRRHVWCSLCKSLGPEASNDVEAIELWNNR
jgi:hypothetical protein